jgi:uncharacterized protein (DUF1015 family)
MKHKFKVIPKEEVLANRSNAYEFINLDKQETLEEAAHEYFKRGQLGFEKAADTEMAFIKGAKWQQEQDKKMYSEEQVQDYAEYYNAVANPKTVKDYFKNK